MEHHDPLPPELRLEFVALPHSAPRAPLPAAASFSARPPDAAPPAPFRTFRKSENSPNCFPRSWDKSRLRAPALTNSLNCSQLIRARAIRIRIPASGLPPMPKPAPSRRARGPMRFQATLERLPSRLNWTVIYVPFDAGKLFGVLGQIKIKGQINGFPFRSCLFPRTQGGHILLVNKRMQRAAKARPAPSPISKSSPTRKSAFTQLPMRSTASSAKTNPFAAGTTNSTSPHATKSPNGSTTPRAKPLRRAAPSRSPNASSP